MRYFWILLEYSMNASFQDAIPSGAYSAHCPLYLILSKLGKMTQTQEQIRKWVILLSINCHLMPLPSRLLGNERN